MWGFQHLKDVLEVVLVPAVGGAIAIIWPLLQAWDKRTRFEAPVSRELEELRPFPKQRVDALRSWIDHQKKDFIHKRILADASENRDLILRLDSSLVYEVSQLWDALGTADETQWLYYLKLLAQRYQGNVAVAFEEWDALIASFKK